MDKKLAALHLVIDDLIVTTFRAEQDMPKWSIEPTVIEQAAKQAGFKSVTIIDQPKAALQALIDRPEPVVLVTGSFYLLQKYIRPLVKGEL